MLSQVTVAVAPTMTGGGHGIVGAGAGAQAGDAPNTEAVPAAASPTVARQRVPPRTPMRRPSDVFISSPRRCQARVLSTTLARSYFRSGSRTYSHQGKQVDQQD